MDLARAHSAVSPGLAGDVLVTLANTTRPLTGREVARIAPRGSARGVQSALDRLVDQGIVERNEAGRALLYTLNRDHVAAPLAVALAQLRATLVDRIRDEIAGWPVAAHQVSLFGSFARGDGGVASDIDLLVVRPAGVSGDDEQWRAQLDALSRRVERWSGNLASIVEIPLPDLARLRRERPPVVGELIADGIVLIGPAIAELLGGRE